MIEHLEDELWIALQICDSSFPGGAFAHSLGLESALQHKFINGGAGTLDLFVSLALEQACAQLIPLVSSAHGLFLRIGHDVDIHPQLPLRKLIRIDELCHVTLTNEVARRSSVNQGKCFFRATKEAFTSTSVNLRAFVGAVEQQSSSGAGMIPPFECVATKPTEEDSPVLIAESNRASRPGESNDINHKLQFHYAPIFGAVCARLNIMGPLEGARMQREYSPVVEKLLSTKCNRNMLILASSKFQSLDLTLAPTPTLLVQKYNAVSDNSTDINIRTLLSVGIDVSEPVTTSPILEILQARHDVLYARLFNS